MRHWAVGLLCLSAVAVADAETVADAEPAKRPVAPVATVRAGIEHLVMVGEDDAPDAWGPSIEAGYYHTSLVVLHVGVARFSDHIQNQVDELERVTVTAISAGIRLDFRPIPRLHIAPGIGLIDAHSRNHAHPALLFDLLVAIELARIDFVSIEISGRWQLGYAGEDSMGSSMYGLGASFMK